MPLHLVKIVLYFRLIMLVYCSLYQYNASIERFHLKNNVTKGGFSQMKFTDGNWLIRDEFTLSTAVQAYDFQVQDHTLIASASTTPIRGRGDMINTTLLTMQFHSPLPGVIGVKLIHFAGTVDHGPHFELAKGGDHAEITENEQYAELKSGSLSVRINKGPQWSVDFIAVASGLPAAAPNRWRTSPKRAATPICVRSLTFASANGYTD